MASERGRETGLVLSAASLGRVVPEGARLLLDTSALIAYFGTERTTPVAAAVIDGFVRSGRNPAVVSVVSITELVVRPLRAADPALADDLIRFLVHVPNLTLGDVDLALAREAGSLRATLGLAAPDALILATGLVERCGHVISNDRQWQAQLARVGSAATVVRLDDHLPYPA